MFSILIGKAPVRVRCLNTRNAALLSGLYKPVAGLQENQRGLHDPHAFDGASELLARSADLLIPHREPAKGWSDSRKAVLGAARKENVHPANDGAHTPFDRFSRQKP